MDISIMEDLGLTQAEIKVYMALLELGSTTAGKVVERSGLQNSVVHRALNSLIERGLINYILEGRRRTYQATDPKNFFNFIEDKKKRFEQVLPELKKKQQLAGKKEVATVYKGPRGLKEVYNTIIGSKAKEYLTFGGGKPCEDLLGTAWWLNMHKRRVANGLPARQIYDETVREIGKEVNKMPLSEVRFVSKEFAQLQETVIAGDYVAINVFTESPYGFLIRDRIVADGYRKHFELLWKLAKK
ncbi:MAG: helix-turn-helix domain-containing protein [Candidatus Micrarchaeota archaeon]